MGCWNETCAISKLPIRNGENIVVILISRSLGFDPARIVESRCYSDSFWSPFGFPIYAKYNDYGWIEKEEKSEFLDWTLGQLDQQLVEVYIDRDGEENNIACKGQMTVEYLGDLLHEGNVFIRNNAFSPHGEPVGPMFVRRDIYETMLNEYRTKRYNRNPDGGFENGTYTEYDWTFHKNKIESSLDIEKLKIEKSSLREIFPTEDKFHKFIIASIPSQLENVLRPFNVHLFEPFDMVDAKDRFVYEAGRMLAFKECLEQLRMHYGLSQGSGSQSQEYPAYERFYKMCLNVVTELQNND